MVEYLPVMHMSNADLSTIPLTRNNFSEGREQNSIILFDCGNISAPKKENKKDNAN